MSPPEPLLGPLAKAAIRLPIEGRKRRKALVLIAAYADAGEQRPDRAAMCKRLSFDEHTLRQILGALEREGWVRRSRRRTRGARRSPGRKGGNFILLFDGRGQRVPP